MAGAPPSYSFFSVLVRMPCEAPTLPSATRPLVAARPRHARPTQQPSACVLGETTGTSVQLGERGVWKGVHPGTACSIPVMVGDH